MPYFIVGPKNLTLDGSHPTILYAYGGFGASETPYYSGTLGKLWLERGGVFVLANIRGGGEFGPAWHEAGLKTHRQLVFDDFAAVARDLIAAGSRPRAGSASRADRTAGSDGRGVHAASGTVERGRIQVPLLDMLRYEQIQAGASWVGEYGSVANPGERAFLASISPYTNLKSGVRYPEAVHLDDDEGRSRRPAARAKIRRQARRAEHPVSVLRGDRRRTRLGRNSKERSFTSALAMTYFTQQLMQ